MELLWVNWCTWSLSGEEQVNTLWRLYRSSNLLLQGQSVGLTPGDKAEGDCLRRLVGCQSGDWYFSTLFSRPLKLWLQVSPSPSMLLSPLSPLPHKKCSSWKHQVQWDLHIHQHLQVQSDDLVQQCAQQCEDWQVNFSEEKTEDLGWGKCCTWLGLEPNLRKFYMNFDFS